MKPSLWLTGDNIALMYNNKKYEIEIRETKPGPAISVIETDCNVDFEAPKDYKPPEPKEQEMDEEMADAEEEQQEEDPDAFYAFSGTATRLDGKPLASRGDPVKVDLLKGSIRLPPPPAPDPETKAQTSSQGQPKGQKAGKVVLSGNKLLDKLNKSKDASGSQPKVEPPPEPKEKAVDGKDAKEANGFTAFSGKGFSLK